MSKWPKLIDLEFCSSKFNINHLLARFENLNQNAMSRKKRNPVHLIKQCTDNIEEYGYNYKYKSLNGYFDTFQVQIDRLVWINRSRRLLGSHRPRYLQNKWKGKEFNPLWFEPMHKCLTKAHFICWSITALILA